MSEVLGLASLVVLILINAFFVAAEFAVISARRSQVEPLAEQGRSSAMRALRAMERATLMLSTTQLGITVASLLILEVSEPAIHDLLAAPLRLTGLPDPAIVVIAVVVALLLVTFLHVVFGELVPKNIAFSAPDRSVLLLATPLLVVARIFRPIIAALNGATTGLVKLLGVEPKSEANSTFTLDEVATIVDTSRREGTLHDESGTLSAAFEFTEKKVQDVSLPLDGIVSLGLDASPADLERAVAQSGFSRYVVVGPDGDAVGYLHLKDILELDERGYGQPIPRGLVRPLLALRGSTDLEDALEELRHGRNHVARVIDDTGATRGILFLEDVIEVLVGEVQDATRR